MDVAPNMKTLINGTLEKTVGREVEAGWRIPDETRF